jgi:hypothetical protein
MRHENANALDPKVENAPGLKCNVEKKREKKKTPMG